MPNQFSRTELLLGKAAIEKLQNSRVIIFGIGGVGSYAAEALVRGGVGTLDIVDNDTVCVSNINRQLFATAKTVGQDKVEAAKARLAEINPNAVINTHKTFYLPGAEGFDFSLYDYVVDAVDTLTAKIEIVLQAQKADVPVISAMGAGNKLDPASFAVTDIYKTTGCPLAKAMRKELKTRGVKALKTVCSTEIPLKPISGENADNERASGRPCPGSTSFVPPVVGLIMAGEVIKDLIGYKNSGITN